MTGMDAPFDRLTSDRVPTGRLVTPAVVVKPARRLRYYRRTVILSLVLALAT
jgi:hypothetical protein